MSARRWRLPMFLSGIVLLSQAFRLPSQVRDAATLEWTQGFSLHFPFWHLFFTPFCSLADTLTVLSYHEEIVLIAWVLCLFFLIGGLGKGLKLTVCLLLFLAWGALVPRPMGRLVSSDSDRLLIDFHSHTQISHDGRPMFTAERNMEWHKQQGFNASFITDHNRVESAAWAKEDSKADWKKTGYRSLEGEEVSLYKTHLVLLGNHAVVDNKSYDSDKNRIRAFVTDMSARGLPVVASLPEYWWYHWPGADAGPLAGQDLHAGTYQDFLDWGMAGFEIINSAPKAMDFPLSKRLEIVDLCRNRNRFITGISDNHGYGYATAVWNAMPLPGWQALDPDSLEQEVLSALKTRGFQAVQVLERVRFIPNSVWALASTPFLVLYLYWRSLQAWQAVSWIVWLWAFYFCYPSRIRFQQRSGPKR